MSFDIFAAQEACSLLLLLNNGVGDCRKIFQILYLADRKSINEMCYDSIFGDNYIKTDYGMFPNKLYKSIISNNVKNIEFLNNELILKNDIGTDHLSDYDVEILTYLYNKYKNLSISEIAEIMNNFKENKYSEFDKYQLMEELGINKDVVKEIKDRDDHIDYVTSFLKHR
jgi:hypothetical protein